MNEAIKCPQCGGNRVQSTGGIYKCMYCGMQFKPVETEKNNRNQSFEKQTSYEVPNGTAQNIINVNVAPQPQPQVYTQQPTAPNYQYADRKSKSTAAVLAFF